MKTYTQLTITILLLFLFGCSGKRYTQLSPSKLSQEEIALLKKDLAEREPYYDKEKNMLWTITHEKHYHSDFDSGIVVHDTRSSIEYAVALMHTTEPQNIERGIDIVKAILPLQEKNTDEPFCGVWPYYPEDPLMGRKAPVDYNWADFMAIPLIDIVINFSDYTDDDLKEQIKNALILAARSIKKRDVKGDYTNVFIMGTYVCYIVGNLYDLPDISNYARNRLAYFYGYTKDNKGFTEYNSPTYTVVAMNELLRMKRTIINPTDKAMIDELYSMCWDIIARHFHQPSGQWCGPNLRAYSSLLTPDLKRLLFTASEGKIELPGDYPRIPNVLMPHKIPATMIPVFTNQTLPRTEIDTFTVGKFQGKNHVDYPTIGTIEAQDIVGKLYANSLYALASVNQGYMWNQCRPIIAHWGTPVHPTYLQVRFLHDFYDFSAAHVISGQDSSTVLSIFNIAYNGGDKHPIIDKIKDSTIYATDLRLRVEIGGNISGSKFSVTDKNEVMLNSGNLSCLINLPYVNWEGLTGYWEIGGDENNRWADYVLYSGNKRKFNFAEMQEAVIGFYLSILSPDKVPPGSNLVKADIDSNYLRLSLNDIEILALKKPDDEFRIGNDYKVNFK